MELAEHDPNAGYSYSNGSIFSSSSNSSTMSSSDDESAAKAKERDVLLWLITVAHGGSLRDDLKEPYYSDGQGNKQLKPDYVLGLTSGELYAYAVGNIYRNPSYRNFTHDEILQLLTKRGTRPSYANGSPVTETDLGFNRPIRLRAHLLLIDAIMLLAHKESLLSSMPSSSSNQTINKSPSAFDRPAGLKKTTAFAPLPNTASWLNYASHDDSLLNLSRNSDSGGDGGLPENHFQPGHPQVTNIRLALEEKRRKKQGDASKKGYEWMQQNAKFGETAFMQSGPGTQPKQPEEEEHVYEEINENQHDPTSLSPATTTATVINSSSTAAAGNNNSNAPRRAKWTEQSPTSHNNHHHNGSGDAAPPSGLPGNVYSTRPPPKPLPRRNMTSGETTPTESSSRRYPHNGSSSSVLENGNYDMPDDDREDAAVTQSGDSALQFLSAYATPQQQKSSTSAVPARTKPKVIRNPPPPTVLSNGSATFSAATFKSISNVDRLRSPVIQREFANSVDVLNPNVGGQFEPQQRGNTSATARRNGAVTVDGSNGNGGGGFVGSGGGSSEGDEDDGGVTSFELVDQSQDSEMERKRLKLMQLQQKRRSEQEAARISKEQENAERSDLARQRQEEASRKKEEERIRRQAIMDNYQRKKAESKTAEDLPSPGHVTMRDNKARRARPLSVHTNSIGHHASFDHGPMSGGGSGNTMKKSPSQGDIMRVGQELSILSLHNPRLAAASARQQGGSFTERRAISPPPRYRTGTAADSTSDAGSSNSGGGHEIPVVYNGPKLFRKPVTKSNRLIIHNAIRDSCLPGIVNEDLQRKALDALARSDECHFFVLFRDANCQFRGVYAYDPDMNEAVKIYGVGPNRIDDSMTEKLYKYNSGMKKFTVITTTHHMSVQIDGITIQSAVWLGKKAVGHKAPLEIF